MHVLDFTFSALLQCPVTICYAHYPPTATIHPMLPTWRNFFLKFPILCLPLPPFFSVSYVPVFFRGVFLVFLDNFCESGSGTVVVVGQQSSLIHCIWHWSAQINLTWLCNCMINMRPACVWIRVVLFVCCPSARLVMFPWFAIICSPLCLLKRSPGIYHEVLIAM